MELRRLPFECVDSGFGSNSNTAVLCSPSGSLLPSLLPNFPHSFLEGISGYHWPTEQETGSTYCSIDRTPQNTDTLKQSNSKYFFLSVCLGMSKAYLDGVHSPCQALTHLCGWACLWSMNVAFLQQKGKNDDTPEKHQILNCVEAFDTLQRIPVVS